MVAFGMFHERMLTLGDLRRETRTCLVCRRFVGNERFHNRADNAFSEPFQTDLTGSLDEEHKQRYITVCSEATWWHHHRCIVADYLIVKR